jgi:hypothetical protein
MEMVRYNPWGVSELQNEINRVLRTWGDRDSSGATAAWVPSADILEYDQRFQLFVDLFAADRQFWAGSTDSALFFLVGTEQGSPCGFSNGGSRCWCDADRAFEPHLRDRRRCA